VTLCSPTGGRNVITCACICIVLSADTPITSERQVGYSSWSVTEPKHVIDFSSLILILWNRHTLVSSLVAVICQFSAGSQTCFAWDWSSCEPWQMFLTMADVFGGMDGPRLPCPALGIWNSESQPFLGCVLEFWITAIFLGSETSHKYACPVELNAGALHLDTSCA